MHSTANSRGYNTVWRKVFLSDVGGVVQNCGKMMQGLVGQHNFTMKIHPSCEIEDFVETHRNKLWVILQSHVLRVLCAH